MCGKENNKYHTKNHLCGILSLYKAIQYGIVGNKAANRHESSGRKAPAGDG